MLTTPALPLPGFQDCDACHVFDERLRAADEPNWTMEYRLPSLHPDLEPAGENYGIPGSGFGRHFRCRGCGTIWDVSLLCDHGLERATLAEPARERCVAHLHHGPWTDLVDLSGLPCRLTLTEYSFELQGRVAAERVHPDVLAILSRPPFPGVPSPLEVRVEAGLQCLRGAGLTDPAERRGVIRGIRTGAPIQPGRCTETWRRELLDAVAERGRVLGIAGIEAESFELQTVGSYTLDLDGRPLSVVLSSLQLFVGDLQYSSAGFLQETDLPEPYLVWLFELLMACPPVAELESGWAELQRRGMIPTGAVPLCNVVPAFVEHARRTYGSRGFRAWSSLVLHAPGVHLFHDVEAGEGDVDGRCRGQVRNALWPSDTESG